VLKIPLSRALLPSGLPADASAEIQAKLDRLCLIVENIENLLARARLERAKADLDAAPLVAATEFNALLTKLADTLHSIRETSHLEPAGSSTTDFAEGVTARQVEEEDEEEAAAGARTGPRPRSSSMSAGRKRPRSGVEGDKQRDGGSAIDIAGRSDHSAAGGGETGVDLSCATNPRQEGGKQQGLMTGREGGSEFV